MSVYAYLRSVAIFALLLGQPALWFLVIRFPDPQINWQSPAMLTALGAMFLFCGIVGTHTWIWYDSSRA